MILFQSEAATPMDEVQGKLFAVLAGEDPQEVVPLVDTQMRVAEREINEIPGRVQSRGTDFAQGIAPAEQQVLEQLRAYHSWLGRVREALENGNVVAVHEEGQELIPALTQATEEFSRQFSTFGSYKSSWTNALSRLAEGICAGQAEEETWDNYLAECQTSLQAKIAQLQSALVPGRGVCAQSYARAAEALQGLLEVEALNPEALRPTLEALDEAISQGEQQERMLLEAMQGEAALPATNVVVNLVRRQDVPRETVTAVIEEYRSLMDSFWENFERSVSRPVDSALVKDEIPRALETGDAHDAAVEELGNAYARGDSAAVERAVQELIATASRLDESREVFATAAQHQSTTLCPGCGRANPPENRRCEACGNQLPSAADGGVAQASSSFNVMTGPALEETEQLQMTENVARLFQACDDVAVGKITHEQFLAELQNAGNGLKEYADELEEIAGEMADESQMTEEQVQIWREQHLPYMQELGASFAEGLAHAESGLGEMAAFLTDQDQDHLVQGVRIVWEGLQMVHRAQLSLTSTMKMLDDVMEEAREKGYLSEEGQEA